MPSYDFLVVGAGLFGSVFARQMTDAGAKCLVVEKREHIGGNCYTKDVDGIQVHQFGPHIFHTNNRAIWDYVNRYVEFNRFTYRPRVCYQGRYLSFPINLTTLNQLWGVTTPAQAKARIERERVVKDKLDNLEDWALSQVGRELYETFIYGYTKKQWGREPKQLPASIIRRIPIRLTWNDDYFDDRYCGIPIGGYTQLFHQLLDGIPVEHGVDFIEDRQSLESLADQVVYTGPLDRLFHYEHGANDWRGLRFEQTIHETSDYQGIAAVNYTDGDVPHTRTIEHKHFDPVNTSHTVVTREFPSQWKVGDDMFYPVNQPKNEELQRKYAAMLPKNYIAGGRLAAYKYYDMHQVIASAIKQAGQALKGRKPSSREIQIRRAA